MVNETFKGTKPLVGAATKLATGPGDTIERMPEGGTVAVLGLSYKPNTDVVEESPGLLLVHSLALQGINVIGGSFPARLWSAFMGQALADVPAGTFPQPDPALMPPLPSAGAAPGSTTPVTTWCSSSCPRPGPGKRGPK